MQAFFSWCDRKSTGEGAPSLQSAAGDAKGLLESFREALKKHRMLSSEYVSKYGAYPADVPLGEVNEAVRTGRAPAAR